MYIPSSTYRVQLHGKFNFSQLLPIAEYLQNLGISTVYAAPMFQASEGSTHGYNVVNPECISPEIGTEKEFVEIIALLQSYKMGWLQDIVPNHMAYHSQNKWIMDIFEKGQHSQYSHFFDIDWHHPHPQLTGKLIFPFLNEEFDEAVNQRHIQLIYSEQGIRWQLEGNALPVAWTTYYDIITAAVPVPMVLQTLAEKFSIVKRDFDNENTRLEMPHYLLGFNNLVESDSEAKAYLTSTLTYINDRPELLRQLLDGQYFRPAHYSYTDHEINYRRFFVINDLICLNVQNQEVFDKHHKYLKNLIDKKYINGLRIDHIDGLQDPEAYLHNLRGLMGDSTYIVVEKILESSEILPARWPVQGTSGYEFLALANRLYTSAPSEDDITEIYENFIGQKCDYDTLVLEKKYAMLSQHMEGELNNLLILLNDYLALEPSQILDLKEPLALLMTCLPVYRTYISSFPIPQEDQAVISSAFEKAFGLAEEYHVPLEVIESVFKILPLDTSLQIEKKVKFIMRFQQYTSPLAAKGVEDTVFYVYNRLISNNEVGDCPKCYSISVPDFHKAMAQRQQFLPYSINTTTTHDTKRGEDARMRINALTHMTPEWESSVLEWREWNKKFKHSIEGKDIPTSNDEYFIYQSLVGGYPLETEELATFAARFQDFMVKAIQEAKENTQAARRVAEYEEGIKNFISAILHSAHFMEHFQIFVKKVAHYAIPLSLSQTLVKITAPGIPDIYQGTELWDLSFVDPDNRRHVDYTRRLKHLSEFKILPIEGLAAYLVELREYAMDGRIKFYTTLVSLNLRRLYPNLFSTGAYLPLEIAGPQAANFIAFARQLGEQWCLVVAPISILVSDISDLWIMLPANAPTGWQNLYSRKSHLTEGVIIHASEESTTAFKKTLQQENVVNRKLDISDVLLNFPVALMMGIVQEDKIVV